MTLRPPIPSTGAMWIGKWVLISAVYYGAARLGLLLASVHDSVSPVWPATGIAIGALLLGGSRLWPGVLLGAFAANAFTSVPLLVAACIAMGNTLEAVVGAWVVRKSAARFRQFEMESLADASALALASIVAPVVSASCGVLVLRAYDSSIAVGALWWTWWVGDALGALLVAPLMVSAAEALPRWRCLKADEIIKALVVFTTGAAMCALIFFKPAGVAFLFAIFPVMLLAATWLGSFGVKTIALLISAIGISAAFFGSGPFSGGSLNEDLLHLQLFLTSVATAALVLPAFRTTGSLNLAGGVLLTMWLISGWLFAALHQDRLRADVSRLDVLIAEAENGIRQRLVIYEDALRGGAGLLSATSHVTRSQWGAYAQSLRLPERYPGVRGIGVIFRVASDGVLRFVADARADGMPDFMVYEAPGGGGQPAAGREERFIITYIEPVESNRPALGFDIASETNRRIAAETSRDTGEPRITGRITLVQDDRRGPGFLLLMPIYRSAAPVETIAQRRSALVAWIYSPFVTESFFAGVLGTLSGEISVRCFVGEDTTAENRVYPSTAVTSRDHEFERVTHLALGGQTFTLGWNRGPRFALAGRSAALWAATSMALISLLVAGLVMSLHAVGQRAREIAARRTAELAASSERLLAANRLLKEKNAEFQNFAHTASHDLREPLRTIQGFTELLVNDCKGILPPDGQDLLRRIHSATTRMSGLIENLLAYAEVESGAWRTERVDLNEVLSVVEHDLRTRIDRVRGRIEHSVPLPTVPGDATQLRQLFQNLIGNALKFHHPDVPPVVIIQAETMGATESSPSRVKVTISDNGIGFDPRNAERIFRPFDRLHGRSEFEGSGLGLAICKRVVERHGGEIYATGTPGAGATLVFTLLTSDG